MVLALTDSLPQPGTTEHYKALQRTTSAWLPWIQRQASKGGSCCTRHLSVQDASCYHLRLLQYDKIDAQTGTRPHKTAACSNLSVSRLPSRLASARLMGRSSYFQNPPHSLAISNGRRWGFDGPVQRTGARAGSVQRCRETHAVNARGSTGPSSVVGRNQRLRPSSLGGWCVTGAASGSTSQRLPSIRTQPVGSSSGRSGFGARLMDMNGDGTPLLSAQHAVALQHVLRLSAQGACAGVRIVCRAVSVGEGALLASSNRRGQATARWGEAPDESRFNLASHTRATNCTPPAYGDLHRKTGIRCRMSTEARHETSLNPPASRQLSGLKHMAVDEFPDLILAKLAQHRILVLSQVGCISPSQQ
ncbi:hypothetical protein TRIATDRAFT_276863 [Trichoderma atroviride IMI 206040]|uniref:Uncharacterized protein n=1 Tax=Hypocrea atroviridis (strain ATCC 20476 / IMI 206040) TaxID=452589 RepID=G9P2I3_HYPAI|nr:uncharacterized protein TRIATDRAFT_276863 [Trichoderma atroviride IMI 206040]EHK43501.1 hypothetical protein TRIATDRAFT_276863 [Trichoderma atroviride IMI 206040]